MSEFEAVIGLEVHSQLRTNTKIFCSCTNKFGAEPNTQTCPVCLGLPGSLPVLNEKVIQYAVTAAVSLDCKIHSYSKFDRKNYFYPDLPKAYQISQYDMPLATEGKVTIEFEDGTTKDIKITRIHIEEDAGKLIHSSDNFEQANKSYADYNRTGTPLIEIVSEPDMRSPHEAFLYMKTIRQILLYAGVSDCNMEEGSLRCDANISIRKKGETKLGVKTELKNMNSFKFVEKALDYEINRQTKLLKKGETICQETRLFDSESGKTLSMRKKEEAHDYRYFPEPDLPPIIITDEYLENIKKDLPENPSKRKKRFIEELKLSDYDAKTLISEKDTADYFEDCVKNYKGEPKQAANWILSELSFYLNKENKSILECGIKPESLVDLLIFIDDGKISGKIAKEVLADMFNTGKEPGNIIKEKGLIQITDSSEIEKIIDEVIKENPAPVDEYKNGKDKAIGFLVGQTMKKSRGKANPGKVNEILKKKIRG